MDHSEVYYKDYLQLDKILNAQELQSAIAGVDAHDEMLFIITHQAYELWFKQVLFEIDSVAVLLNEPRVDDNKPTLQTVVHRLSRVNTILSLLVKQIDVMETMTSLDFLDFRDLLRPASGFQSVQWKELEAKLGLRFEDRHGKEYYVSQLRKEDVSYVKEVETSVSLLELVVQWLERMPYFDDKNLWPGAAVVPAHEHPFWSAYREAYGHGLLPLEQGNLDLLDNLLFGKEENSNRRFSARACRAALFIMLYRGFPMLHQPFKLLTALLETDELMSTWRTRHMNMVYRMIGSRIGTGNSSGRSYLRAAIDKHYVFAELAELNGLLMSRKDLPRLPEALMHNLGFAG